MNALANLTERERKFVRLYASRVARQAALAGLWWLGAIILLNVCLNQFVLGWHLGFADLMAFFFFLISAIYFVLVIRISKVLSKLMEPEK